jgi:DNA-binding transcriptional ArsR family regulator
MKGPYHVTSPKQIAVISSPGRDEIMDMIGIIGPCTVSELARATGRSRHALYYHLRALDACGLLKLSRVRKRGAREAVRYEVAGRPLVVHFDLTTAKSRQLVLDLAHARIRGGTRGFDRACNPTIANVEGSRRNLWATRWKGWLSPTELEEVNRYFAKLIDAMHAQPGNMAHQRKCYEFTFVFAPSVPQPVHAETPGRTQVTRTSSRRTPARTRAAPI